MKKIVLALLAMAMLLWGCANVTQTDLSASQDNAISEDAATISENAISDNSVSEDAISENEVQASKHDDRVCLVISISENEVEMYEKFTFSRLPDCVQDLEELQEMGLLYFNDPYFSAALELACLCEYTKDADNGLAMLEYLNGPEELTEFEKNFTAKKLNGMEYKPFSYFEGASPENNYTPTEPYTVTISGDKYTWAVEERVKVFVYSSGATARRAINVRHEASDDHWYVYEHGLLGDMEIPVALIEESVSENSVSENSLSENEASADQTNVDAANTNTANENASEATNEATNEDSNKDSNEVSNENTNEATSESTENSLNNNSDNSAEVEVISTNENAETQTATPAINQ